MYSFFCCISCTLHSLRVSFMSKKVQPILVGPGMEHQLHLLVGLFFHAFEQISFEPGVLITDTFLLLPRGPPCARHALSEHIICDMSLVPIATLIIHLLWPHCATIEAAVSHIEASIRVTLEASSHAASSSSPAIRGDMDCTGIKIAHVRQQPTSGPLLGPTSSPLPRQLHEARTCHLRVCHP